MEPDRTIQAPWAPSHLDQAVLTAPAELLEHGPCSVIGLDRHIERSKDVLPVHHSPQRLHHDVFIAVSKIEIQREIAKRKVDRRRDGHKSVVPLDQGSRHGSGEFDVGEGDVAPSRGGKIGFDYNTTLQKAPTVVRLGRTEIPSERPLLML